MIPESPADFRLDPPRRFAALASGGLSPRAAQSRHLTVLFLPLLLSLFLLSAPTTEAIPVTDAVRIAETVSAGIDRYTQLAESIEREIRNLERVENWLAIRFFGAVVIRIRPFPRRLDPPRVLDTQPRRSLAMNARSIATMVVLASFFSDLPARAQEADADQPSLLQQFLDSLAPDLDSPSDDLDAEFTNDPDLDRNPAALADEPLEMPVEIPRPLPLPVFHKRPEDDGFEVPMRETFPFEAFDFEQGTPTLYCLPSRVCSIELEPGEVLLGRAMGDPDRWLYQELTAGPANATRVLLAFMPKSFGARTNLVLATDRRIYTLALASAEIDPAGDAASAPLTERARFSYPQAWAASRQRPTPKPLVVKARRRLQRSMVQRAPVPRQAQATGLPIAGSRFRTPAPSSFSAGVASPQSAAANDLASCEAQRERLLAAAINRQARPGDRTWPIEASAGHPCSKCAQARPWP